MKVVPTIGTVRAATKSISGFRKKFIQSSDADDRLFEFAALAGMVARLRSATGKGAVVVVQGQGYFARKPGKRGNFNYIQVGDFDVYFGVEFEGVSGASHAPDVVVAVDKGGRTHPLLVVECKCYANAIVLRELTNAFAGVLNDLGRPYLPDDRNDVLVGARFVRAPQLGDARLAKLILAMTDSGWSFLETTCTSAPVEQKNIGRLYGFLIHTPGDPDSLV